MAAFYEWLRNIVICLFLISLIDQLFPDSDYKKYMRVAAGLILIIVVMTPVLKIFGADVKLSYFLNLETLKTELETIHYPEEMYTAEQERFKYATENYKNRLETEVAALFQNHPIVLKNVSVEIDEEADSENFGRVLFVSATASLREEKKSGTVVEPIVIGTDSEHSHAESGSRDASDMAADGTDTLPKSHFIPAEYAGDISDMKEKIADYLCMDVSAVTISMD